jgi:hypothetical protein
MFAERSRQDWKEQFNVMSKRVEESKNNRACDLKGDRMWVPSPAYKRSVRSDHA